MHNGFSKVSGKSNIQRINEYPPHLEKNLPGQKSKSDPELLSRRHPFSLGYIAFSSVSIPVQTYQRACYMNHTRLIIEITAFPLQQANDEKKVSRRKAQLPAPHCTTTIIRCNLAQTPFYAAFCCPAGVPPAAFSPPPFFSNSAPRY